MISWLKQHQLCNGLVSTRTKSDTIKTCLSNQGLTCEWKTVQME